MYSGRVSIEFDPKKAAANLRKHGVSFAEAEPVFHDPLALTRQDVDALGEPRFVTLGIGALGRLLMVCWTPRDSAVRVISARVAGIQERKSYEG